MIRRGDRPGYWFKKRVAGRTVVIALGTDYQEACRKLRGFAREELPVSEVSVTKAAEQWLASYVATRRNEKGKQLSTVRAATYLTPFMGHVLLSRLTGEHVRSYRLHLEGLGRSQQTVTHLLSDLRCLLLWCEEAGLIRRSPFPKKVMPRLQETPPQRLSDEDVERLVGLPEPHGRVCQFLLATGLRWSEACRAQAKDVERGFLVVHQTKSGKIRRVPLTPGMLAELRGRVGRLIPFSSGSPGSFARVVRRLSDVEEFHPHRLRHTFACKWLEEGRSLPSLQLMLGHASITTTQRYAKLTDEAVRDEMMRGRMATVAATSR